MNNYKLVFDGTLSEGRHGVQSYGSGAESSRSPGGKSSAHQYKLPVCRSTGPCEHTASPQTHQIADEPVMKIGEVNSPQAFHHPASQLEEAREPVEKKIGRGIGDILSGILIIGIGLVWGGSIFLGNADALDVFFDCLGIFWIVKGIYKMIS